MLEKKKKSINKVVEQGNTVKLGEKQYSKEIETLKSINQKLTQELQRYQKKLKNIENSVRDEYLHTADWTKEALIKLVNFAAIELEPASAEEFPAKVVKFLGSDTFDYPYVGFFKHSSKTSKWVAMEEKGVSGSDIENAPVFTGNMVLEEEEESYNFFSVQSESYLLCVSTVGIDKKLSRHDFSFISLFVTLMSSFFNMKLLANEVEKRMIEAATLRNVERLLNSLKNNSITLEEVFSEISLDLSIDSFAYAVKLETAKDDLKIVLTKGLEVRSWDSFLKTILENDDCFQEEWAILPLIDEEMHLYGVPVFKLSHNNPSLRHIQDKVLSWIIPQLTTILSQKKLHKESITDVLTGVYNRRYALRILEEKFRKAAVEEEALLSVAMLDIDHFKPVNDTHGHQAGDKILKEVALLISNAVREIDIVGRYGGEEFIIILGVGKNGARNVCERIRKSIETNCFYWDDKEIWVTASLGCVTFSEKISTWEEIVSISDMCLYEAKKTGRNKVVVF
jgi:diguanylate cyclase (GGDEF)-like protein